MAQAPEHEANSLGVVGKRGEELFSADCHRQALNGCDPLHLLHLSLFRVDQLLSVVPCVHLPEVLKECRLDEPIVRCWRPSRPICIVPLLVRKRGGKEVRSCNRTTSFAGDAVKRGGRGISASKDLRRAPHRAAQPQRGPEFCHSRQQIPAGGREPVTYCVINQRLFLLRACAKGARDTKTGVLEGAVRSDRTAPHREGRGDGNNRT